MTLVILAACAAAVLNLLAGIARSGSGGLGLRARLALLASDLGEVTLTHRQAVDRMKDITDELERLGSKPDLTDEDEARFHEMTAEFDELDTHRRALERAAALARVRQVREGGLGRIEHGARQPADARGQLGYAHDPDAYDLDPILNPDSVEAGRFRNPWDLSEVRAFGRDRSSYVAELRSRALSAVERMAGATDKVRATATELIETWDDDNGTLSELCLRTSSPEYLRAFAKAVRGKALTPEEQGAVQQVQERAMTLTGTAGGFLIPFQLDPTVIITSNGSRNQIRLRARQVIATGNKWNGVSAGQVTWGFTAGEAVEASDNAPTFAQPSVTVHKAHGFVPISLEALEDEANVTSEVARLLAFGKDALEANKFVLGSGTNEPWGIVSALTGGGSEVASTTADAFAAADVYKLDSSLPARYRANAAWLANRAIYNLIRQFDTGGGAQMWERIGAGMPGELIGQQALEAEDMDGSVTALAANYLLVYGDFDNYVIADRIGFTVELIPHLFGAANRFPTGQRGWYAYYRVGADSVNDGAFRMLNA